MCLTFRSLSYSVVSTDRGLVQLKTGTYAQTWADSTSLGQLVTALNGWSL